jgi:hypothetical protein
VPSAAAPAVGWWPDAGSTPVMWVLDHWLDSQPPLCHPTWLRSCVDAVSWAPPRAPGARPLFPGNGETIQHGSKYPPPPARHEPSLLTPQASSLHPATSP